MKGVTKAALYMRLSKDDEQFGDSISIETQRSILSHFVKEHGFSVFDEYVDDGWTGTNFDRPNFKRMMDDMESGKINCIVTKDDCVILELNTENPEKCGFCGVSSVF
jgi:DNA invertase Pin-like site-specific DNA recombinase